MEFATQVSGATAEMPLLSQILSAGARQSSSVAAQQPKPEAPLQIGKLKSQHRFMDQLTKAIVYNHNREVIKARMTMTLNSQLKQFRAGLAAPLAGEPSVDNDRPKDAASSMHRNYPTREEQRAKYHRQLIMMRASQERERYKREKIAPKKPYGILGLDAIATEERDLFR